MQSQWKATQFGSGGETLKRLGVTVNYYSHLNSKNSLSLQNQLEQNSRFQAPAVANEES